VRRAALLPALDLPVLFLRQDGVGRKLGRKSATGPYAIAYVTLKEGPSLQTNIVDCDMDKLKIGQKVKVVFKPTDGAPLPFFTPA
jgi:uncharacterized OB-fold protein